MPHGGCLGTVSRSRSRLRWRSWQQNSTLVRHDKKRTVVTTSPYHLKMVCLRQILK